MAVAATTADPPAAVFKQAPNLTRDQRRLLRAFTEDAVRLAVAFEPELVDVFEELGELAEAAARQVLRREAARRALFRRKQSDDELAEDAVRIASLIAFARWEQEALIPIWDGHMLRTLFVTVNTINATVGLAVNIPDPVAREVVARGGTQRALLDIPRQARESIFRALHEGSTLGEGPDVIARRIRAQVPAGRFVNAGPQYRAKLIARTETGFSQNVSSYAAYKESGALDGVLVIDAQLGPTDADCEFVNGQVLTFEEADELEPLDHPNCTRILLPNIRVS